MKNLKFSRLFAAMMFVACLALAGCTPVTEEKFSEVDNYIIVRPLEADDAIIGTWAASEYEKYTFSVDNFVSLLAYEGDNILIAEDDESSGRIFIKYTKAIEYSADEPAEDAENPWTYSSWTKNWYRYSSTAPDVGKWYAISYKDLTENSVNISGAGGEKTSFENLKDAVKEFTINNGYFTYYSECTKE